MTGAQTDGVRRTGLSRRAVAGLLGGAGGAVAEVLAAAVLGLWAAAACCWNGKAGLKDGTTRDTGDRRR